jgi:dTDP-4-dehydrorhamnose 3,5-epimerase
VKLTPTAIPDVVLIEPRMFGDDRGWFMESFNERQFQAGLRELGLPVPCPFVQDNHSCSRRGVLRGLHYQLPPHAQGKLMRVTRGAAFDVAVDLRRTSPTYGKWVGQKLSASNQRQLWIPAGFGHGFLALEHDTEFLYKTTDYYEPGSERSVRWNDPVLDIHWPLPDELPPSLASRDAAAPALAEAETFDGQCP